jgi:hypothetical protein
MEWWPPLAASWCAPPLRGNRERTPVNFQGSRYRQLHPSVPSTVGGKVIEPSAPSQGAAPAGFATPSVGATCCRWGCFDELIFCYTGPPQRSPRPRQFEIVMSGTGRDSLMSGKRAPSVAPRPFPAINRRHSDRLRRMGYGPSRFARPVKPCFQRGPLLIGGEDRGWAAHSWHFWPGGDCSRPSLT